MDALKQYGPFALALILAVAGVGLQVAGPEGLAAYGVFGWTAGAVVAAIGVVLLDARWGLISAAAVAAGASGYLFWLKIRPSEGTALCTVNQTIDCESINDSVYSTILADTPVATPITLLGLAFFTGLVGAALWAPRQVPRLFQVAALFGLFNVAVSIYLASILFIEQKVCVFCIAIYLSNLVVVWAAFKGLAQQERSLLQDLGGLASATSFWTVTVAFAGLLVGGHGLMRALDDRPAQPVAAEDGGEIDLSPYYVTAPNPVELDGTEPVLGPEEARYTLVEFADYACPHCAEASHRIHEWMEEQDDVRLMFKAFPLTKECNPAIPRDAQSNFPPRCLPALYAECALRYNRFWEVNKDLFENQRMLANAGFPMEDLDRLVENRGVDPKAIDDCITDSDTLRGIGMDAVAGARAGVQGTPALFVHGVTEDGTWVQVPRGPEDVFTLIELHRENHPAPATTPTATTDEAPDQAPVSGEPQDSDAPASDGGSSEGDPGADDAGSTGAVGSEDSADADPEEG